MTLPVAYGAGVRAAETAFGIRTAAVGSAIADVGKMPASPKHLGATMFTDALEKIHAGPQATKAPWQHKLERDTVWGNKASPEAAGNTINNDPALRHSGV